MALVLTISEGGAEGFTAAAPGNVENGTDASGGVPLYALPVVVAPERDGGRTGFPVAGPGCPDIGKLIGGGGFTEAEALAEVRVDAPGDDVVLDVASDGVLDTQPFRRLEDDGRCWISPVSITVFEEGDEAAEVVVHDLRACLGVGEGDERLALEADVGHGLDRYEEGEAKVEGFIEDPGIPIGIRKVDETGAVAELGH